MDSDTETPSPATEPPAPAKAKTTPFPGREDCWSAEATRTLIEAWGERYVDLSRGNLRQKHWQEVADAVNAGHSGGVGGKARRSDVQCKNRIDTLKKKYKIEKARVSDSGGSYTSPWPFFSRLDDLIGPTFSLVKRPAASPSPSPPLPLPPPSPSVGGSYRNPSPPSWARHSPVPVGPRSFTLKRPAPAPAAADYSGSGRSFFAFAAAVAAMEEEESESERSRPASGSRLRLSRAGRTNGRAAPSPAAAPEMLGQLAEAIERFGEIYQRVEHAKQRQIVELEKQRMQFAKDLEYQRMSLFTETQLQIQKIKRAKRSSAAAADNYS